MSEDLIIKHCSPTLAGIKTGNLFSCQYNSKIEIMEAVRKFNKIFIPKGVKLIPLKFGENRVLIYVYRPQRLQRDLSEDLAVTLLKDHGYKSSDTTSCISRLKSRVNAPSDFPHEIGLFLGYPPEDVQGFILHKGNYCKLTGCWKVYGNEEKAVKEFAKFKKCSDIYYSKWLQGTTIQRLTVNFVNTNS